MATGRPVVVVVLIATAMSNLDQSIVGVALPTLQQVFRADVGLLQWVILAYQLGIIGTLLIAGRAADLVGGRKVFLAGLVLFTASSAVCGAALDAWQLVAARGTQGIGAALLLASGQALLTEAAPTHQRGRAMGSLHMAVAAGLIAGPSLGGLLIELATWRAIFLVNVPLGLLALWLAWRRIPRLAEQPMPGAGWDRSLLHSKTLVLGLFAAFLAFVALAANMFLVPFALQPVMGLSPAEAGFVMIAAPMTILIAAPVSGWLTDRIGPRWPATFGMALVAVAILRMAQLRPASTIPDAVLTLAVYGAGAGLFQAPNNAAVMTAAPAEARGTISGTLALARSLGQVTGVALASAIWSWRQGAYAARQRADAALTLALHDAFLALALVALVTAVISLLRDGPRQPETTQA